MDKKNYPPVSILPKFSKVFTFEKWSKSMNQGAIFGSLLTDLLKAFRFSHDLLAENYFQTALILFHQGFL